MKYFILDLDGTVSKALERSIFFHTDPRNYPAAEAGIIFDEVIEYTKEMIRYWISRGYKVVVLSARSENSRESNTKWLEKKNIPFEDMFLRPSGNYIKDYEIKEKLLYEIIEKYGRPAFAVEDRPDVIEMFRKNGVFCFGIFTEYQ